MTETRRSFLARATAAGVGWLALDVATVEAALAHAARAVGEAPPPPFRSLAAAEAAELAAVAARILPTTDTPGATEAGVIHFIDRALGAEQRRARAVLRRGVADLRARAARRRPGGRGFAALAPDEQDAILAEVEAGEFFQLMRFLTMVGTFGDPALGGNRGGTGWRLIGFDHRPTYAPPFGHYDAEAARGR